MKSVCVFCGSNVGAKPIYSEIAKELGELLVQEGISLVYGGGKIGLMGIIADTCISGGGSVTGVIPNFLAKDEIAHDKITHLIRVETMHERKLKMSQLANGFIAMPGGYGTLEELCEILTWAQLSIIQKPIGILNIDGYYDLFLQQLDKMVDQELLKSENLRFFVTSNDPADLLFKMKNMKIDKRSFEEKFFRG